MQTSTPVVVVKRRKHVTTRSFMTFGQTPPAKPKPAAKLQPTPTEKAAKQAAAQELQLIQQQAAQQRRAEAKQKRLEVNQPLFELLGEKWPTLFGPDAPTVPLKKKIHLDLIASLPEYPPGNVRGAFVHYFNLVRRDYLKALAVGGPRFGLDGQECGAVTEEEQERARVELEGMKGKRVKREEEKPFV